MFRMLDALPGTDLTVMANDSRQMRTLRYTLLDPIDQSLQLLRRSQNNKEFQSYLRERWLFALPLVVGIVLSSLALTVAALTFVAGAGAFLGFLATIILAPIVLVASLAVQAHLLLSWIEGRLLAKLLGRRDPRERGPIGAWLARNFRVDLRPLPQVPWVPALVFFVLPVLMLFRVATLTAVALLVFQFVAAIVFALRDPVAAVAASPARRRVEAPEPPAAPARGAAPVQRARVHTEPDDAWPTLRPAPSPGPTSRAVSSPRPTSRAAASPGPTSRSAPAASSTSRAARPDAASWTRSLRPFLKSGFRRLRVFAEFGLHNLLPLLEYVAFLVGMVLVVTGRKSGSEQAISLGMILVGASLLLGAAASIVTRRMSFRFYSSARAGYAGPTALITGMMQFVLGGLAVVTAHALSTHVWQEKLYDLLDNPWPLLIPLGLLLIGAGLLLMRRSSRSMGALGTLLFTLPKRLIGLAALGAGAAIVVGWAWSIRDPQEFSRLVHLVPQEHRNLLQNGWSDAIAMLL